MCLHARWMDTDSDGLNPDDIRATRKPLTVLCERLERITGDDTGAEANS